jgi:hypothetical protein
MRLRIVEYACIRSKCMHIAPFLLRVDLTPSTVTCVADISSIDRPCSTFITHHHSLSNSGDDECNNDVCTTASEHCTICVGRYRCISFGGRSSSCTCNRRIHYLCSALQTHDTHFLHLTLMLLMWRMQLLDTLLRRSMAASRHPGPRSLRSRVYACAAPPL